MPCSALGFQIVPKALLTPANPPIEDLILLVRGHRVLLDVHLAHLYGVDVKVLNQAVKRNIERFPDDFMFRLTSEEQASLRSQFVTSKSRGGRRYLAFVFTEQGVAMLSSVLRSPQAVQVNIEIMRAFVKLRRLLHSNEDLSRKPRRAGKTLRRPVPGRLPSDSRAHAAPGNEPTPAHRLPFGLTRGSRNHKL